MGNQVSSGGSVKVSGEVGAIVGKQLNGEVGVK